MPIPLRLRAGLLCVALAALWPLPQAFAGIMLNGTRIILNADERGTSMIVSNVTRSDYAVQTWVNDATDSKDRLSPFIAMPALFKLQAGEEQVVRIIKTPGQLPENRESVFYFNAQEIPMLSEKQDNALKVAVRTRVKLFYRPAKLPGSAQQSPTQLSWKLLEQPGGAVLRVINPSAYHITFIGIRVMDGNDSIELQDVDMVSPQSSQDYVLKRKLRSPTATVEFSVINDYGGYSAPLKSDISF
ncbi:fimbrial biogenesis chaperone [Pseudomonas lactis]|uniref:Gram-negative pili assembly chaperone n=1 Tax=Pseudomonas lactis TaxID=1615674 RepID=I4KFZ4_9PSED|nr:molecular chaperone [Pseudomonas lactis]EIK63634.1 gram-negative pili assembly chaperone [Pseudomonas lactis]